MLIQPGQQKRYFFVNLSTEHRSDVVGWNDPKKKPQIIADYSNGVETADQMLRLYWRKCAIIRRWMASHRILQSIRHYVLTLWYWQEIWKCQTLHNTFHVAHQKSIIMFKSKSQKKNTFVPSCITHASQAEWLSRFENKMRVLQVNNQGHYAAYVRSWSVANVPRVSI